MSVRSQALRMLTITNSKREPPRQRIQPKAILFQIDRHSGREQDEVSDTG